MVFPENRKARCQEKRTHRHHCPHLRRNVLQTGHLQHPAGHRRGGLEHPKQRARPKNGDCKQINHILDMIEAEVKEHHRLLLLKGKTVTPEILKATYLGIGQEVVTVLSLFDEIIQDKKAQYERKLITRATFSRYGCTREKVKRFIKDKFKRSDLFFEEIPMDIAVRFEHYLLTDLGIGTNGAIKPQQIFKYVLETAHSRGLLTTRPFFGHKIQRQDTEREILFMDEIVRLMEYQTDNETLAEVRDMFITAVFTGLAFTDTQSLNLSEIQAHLGEQEWIITKRNKTNVNVRVPLFEIPKTIIESYAKKDRKTFFRPISNYHANKYLKIIMAACGIDKDITFHTARHTFTTTICLANDVPLETVKDLLGHTDLRTTQIYAKMLAHKVKRDMNNIAPKFDGLIRHLNQSLSGSSVYIS